jgi:hypothetical protein
MALLFATSMVLVGVIFPHVISKCVCGSGFQNLNHYTDPVAQYVGAVRAGERLNDFNFFIEHSNTDANGNVTVVTTRVNGNITAVGNGVSNTGFDMFDMTNNNFIRYWSQVSAWYQRTESWPPELASRCLLPETLRDVHGYLEMNYARRCSRSLANFWRCDRTVRVYRSTAQNNVRIEITADSMKLFGQDGVYEFTIGGQTVIIPQWVLTNALVIGG